ncbi:ATP-grasp domain-containing protein [Hyphococcus luteus]|nr:hypothetical protein [Marinicaulis flavus]
MIVFATCAAEPALQESDRVLAAALGARGFAVAAAPWNGPQDAFVAADAVVIRSTWDYQKTPDAFADWLARLEGRPNVFNPPAMMRANMSKRYLLDLAGKGAPLPPTMAVEPDPDAIAAAMDALGLAEAVVKPEFGATASGLSVVRREDAAGLAAAAAKMAMPGLVQALVPEITTAGETSFIFAGRAFTHAVTKRPKSGDIRCQADHGGAAALADPPDWAVAEAHRLLAMVSGDPLYARIDAVTLDGEMRLMEVELIEPELFFTYSPDAAARLAGALLERLN